MLMLETKIKTDGRPASLYLANKKHWFSVVRQTGVRYVTVFNV
jgi:hypothetical protein